MYTENMAFADFFVRLFPCACPAIKRITSSTEKSSHVGLLRDDSCHVRRCLPMRIPARDQRVRAQRLEHAHQLRCGLGPRQPMEHASLQKQMSQI
jgi:hypothetical protein